MRADIVKGWLLANPSGGSYYDIAKRTGLSAPAVGRAVQDLHLHDPDVVVSIPAPKNGYTVRAGWNVTSRQGEGNQGRHAATRFDRMAIRWEKAAAAETDPAMKAILTMNAASMRTVAANMRTAADILG